MEGKKALEIVLKNINIEGLIVDLADELLIPALHAVVAKSENKIDDAAVAMLLPLVESKLKEVLHEKLAEILKKAE